MGSSKAGSVQSVEPRAARRDAPDPERRSAGHGAVWSGIALLVFLLAFATLFHDMLGAGLDRSVAASSWGVARDRESGLPALPAPDSLFHTDQRFVVWLTARNAWTLRSSPRRFFEAEPCFPAERSLAFGEPGLSLGLLGVLPSLVTGDPVATFNLVFIALALIAAFAMYLLVRDWTGVPAAGIAAALLYAFSQIKLGDVVHIHVYDNGWTLLALFFGRRLFAAGGWRDALGLSLAIAMQLGGSFYPAIAASLVALPTAIWLLRRHGLGAVRPAQLCLVASSAIAIAAFVFLPYLALRGEGDLGRQAWQSFRSLDYLLPAHDGFWGWLTLALAIISLSPLGRSALREGVGDPRPALVAGALLAIVFSTARLSGGDTLAGGDDGSFVPYMLLAKIVPGLDVVRAPGAILPVAHLLACVLAGIGAAALLQRVPARAAPLAAGLLILLAALDTLRPAFLGATPRLRYGAIQMAPAAETLAFFEQLERAGGRGPLLELPLAPKNLVRSSREVLLTAYHHQRTSSCYNTSRVSAELVGLARQLPHEAALDAVHALGIETIVLHHAEADPYTDALREAFDTAAASGGPEGRLQRIAGSSEQTHYRIAR